MRLHLRLSTPRALFLGLALLCACSGEAPPSSSPTREACVALGDRLVAVPLASVTADRAQHEANLRAAIGAGFVVGCLATTSPGDLRCGIRSADGGSFLACGR